MYEFERRLRRTMITRLRELIATRDKLFLELIAARAEVFLQLIVARDEVFLAM